jgi:hypothetical protein
VVSKASTRDLSLVLDASGPAGTAGKPDGWLLSWLTVLGLSMLFRPGPQYAPSDQRGRSPAAWSAT